jgi:PRC-barrel domain
MLRTLPLAAALAALVSTGAFAQSPAEPPAETVPPATAPGSGPALEEGWSELDAGTVSVDTLIGTDIRTYDQETIAAVQDVVLSADGRIENVVVRFGGVLGFGETTVLLAMDEITVVENANEEVFVLTDLTPEILEKRPVYEPEG